MNPLNLFMLYVTYTRTVSLDFYILADFFIPSKQEEHIILSLTLLITDLDVFVAMYIHMQHISIHIICVDDTHSTDRNSPYVYENSFFQCAIIQTLWSVFELCSPSKISSRCGCCCLERGWLLAARYLCPQPSTEKIPNSHRHPQKDCSNQQPRLKWSFYWWEGDWKVSIFLWY